MRLYIAEKPSVAAAIADGLGGGKRVSPKRGVGYFECRNGDIVTWCIGHLMEVAPPEKYDPAWKAWRAETLPIIPPEWRLLPKDNTKAQFKVVKDLLKKAKTVVHAGDPDREGQLLVDEVLEHLNFSGPVKRYISGATDEKTVKKALASLKNNAEFYNFCQSAKGRQRADALVGWNTTRAITIAARGQGYDGVISSGRVQSPTLAIVVERDLLIENFVPKDYFVPVITVRHAAGTFQATWVPREDCDGLDPSDGKLIDSKVAQKLLESVKGQAGQILQASYQEKQTPPELPFNLSTLQRVASKKFKFSAKRTLELAQALYDKKATTYPRSDTRHLPEEQYADAPGVLASLAKYGFESASGANPEIHGSVWNTKKAPIHHAIIPTEKTPTGLTGDEEKLYKVIANAYIRQFYPPMRYVSQLAVAEIAGEKWKANGKVLLSPGWTAMQGADAPEDKEKGKLPMGMKKGDSAQCADTLMNSKKTSPPARFDDGSLIEAMEKVHKFVTDPEVKKRLRENSGIGTDATRANILETIVKRGFVERNKKGQIISTGIGREVYSQLPIPLRDPGTTAVWEDLLTSIADGKMSLDAFMENQAQVLPNLVQAGLSAKFSKKMVGTVHPCPTCGSALRRLKGKKGHFWACKDREHPLLSDEKGKPGRAFGSNDGPKAPCLEPGCGEQMARRESSKRKGFFFWACTNKKHPLRKDSNGQPSDPMVFKKSKK